MEIGMYDMMGDPSAGRVRVRLVPKTKDSTSFTANVARGTPAAAKALKPD